MTFRKALRSGVAAACIASVAAPAGIAAPAAEAVAKRSGLDARVATAKDFSPAEISGGKVVAKRAGQTIVLTLAGDPDVAPRRTSPHRWISSVGKKKRAGGLQVELTLSAGAEA